ncbi:MAG: hypothetical protein P8171_24760 [Candidatus Thiodiazotropha sp.]
MSHKILSRVNESDARVIAQAPRLEGDMRGAITVRCFELVMDIP